MKGVIVYNSEKIMRGSKTRTIIAVDEDVEVNILKRYDCIGELDLFSDKCIKYSAKAKEDCEIFILNRDMLRKNFYVNLVILEFSF
jgi:CRP-like cAMP-binding protein